MTDPRSPFQNTAASSPPSWQLEAKKLASACRGMSDHVEALANSNDSTQASLNETRQLLHVIGDHLQTVVSEEMLPADPIELSLHLIDYARELPKASTQLLAAEIDLGATTELSRTLPQFSMALMTLSQHVAEAAPGKGPVFHCKG